MSRESYGVAEAARALGEEIGHFVDAPVTGSKAAAANGRRPDVGDNRKVAL